MQSPEYLDFPQPHFSDHFTSSPNFGLEDLPRPSELYLHLLRFTGTSPYDLDPVVETTTMSDTVEGLPGLVTSLINDLTGAIHHKNVAPHSVADAIGWILADITVLGIMAEATCRTQHEKDVTDLKQAYLQNIGQVFSELRLEDLRDAEMSNLQAALKVGARVLNDIFHGEATSDDLASKKSQEG